jgi:hypothetical protein
MRDGASVHPAYQGNTCFEETRFLRIHALTHRLGPARHAPGARRVFSRPLRCPRVPANASGMLLAVPEGTGERIRDALRGTRGSRRLQPRCASRHPRGRSDACRTRFAAPDARSSECRTRFAEPGVSVARMPDTLRDTRRPGRAHAVIAPWRLRASPITSGIRRRRPPSIDARLVIHPSRP